MKIYRGWSVVAVAMLFQAVTFGAGVVALVAEVMRGGTESGEGDERSDGERPRPQLRAGDQEEGWRDGGEGVGVQGETSRPSAGGMTRVCSMA